MSLLLEWAVDDKIEDIVLNSVARLAINMYYG